MGRVAFLEGIKGMSAEGMPEERDLKPDLPPVENAEKQEAELPLNNRPSIMLDPQEQLPQDMRVEERISEKKTPRMPREEPPEFDPIRSEQQNIQMATESTSRWMQAAGESLVNELRNSPDPAAITPEKYSEMTDSERLRLQQEFLKRARIESQLQSLPLIADTMRQQRVSLAGRIAEIQSNFYRENPEIASKVFDLTVNLPAEQQASPGTYTIMKRQILGEEAEKRASDQRLRAMARGASVAGRGAGGADMPSQEVSSQERQVLAKLGLRGKALAGAIERLATRRSGR